MAGVRAQSISGPIPTNDNRQDCFKINYGGVVFPQENKSSIGVIIRNSEGLVIASVAQQLSQAYQAAKIEAMAVVRALQFGMEVGLASVIVEGYCEMVAQTLTEVNTGLSIYEQLAKDANLFSDFFSNLLYSHTKSDGNKVAHSMVRLSINFPDCVVWMEDIPPPILHVIQADKVILI
ncbi:hypothetical protein SO802_000957 [Lithocarpus litseifolius]|uniref:RNase H type-1 domain-containing protein n=1 Tax=Lithocarpus litseifolius TaxID=425828 RepID=A0AAW2DWG6_9ROSI